MSPPPAGLAGRFFCHRTEEEKRPCKVVEDTARYTLGAGLSLQLSYRQRLLSVYPLLATAMPSTSVIRTPCSSANIGPGFDVIGLALSLYLELHVTIDSSKSSSQQPLNCVISYDDQSQSTEKISLDPEVNLITRVALYVLRCHDQRAFPVETHVHIVNPIPLGRGLGSSGTAVVAGVMLGNEVSRLGLSKDRLLDYCLMIGMLLQGFRPL